MANLVGRRAVVIGAGISGLSAAGALRGHFEEVVVLERDDLPATAQPRSGTPQDHHPHGLMAGGLQALDEIFPGFRQDLAAAGAVPVQMATDVVIERPGIGRMPRRDLGISRLFSSRPLIEFVLRQRLGAMAKIRLLPECRVTAIMPGNDAARGVEFETAGKNETLDADLVVDASGRGAPMLDLLNKLGWEAPAATEISNDFRYSTVIMTFPSGELPDWKSVMSLPDAPRSALGAVALRIENDQFVLTVGDIGAGGSRKTWGSFVHALRQLAGPTLYDTFHRMKPIGPVRHFGFAASVWQHYERLARLPRGALPIGDALCRFNPIYGQGMSTAAQQARLLQTVLDRVSAEPDPLAAAQAGFMAEVATVLQGPWAMSTRADLAFPQTRGVRPDDLEQARQFEAAVMRATIVDPVVHRAAMEVYQLLKPPGLLRQPDILARIEAVTEKAVA